MESLKLSSAQVGKLEEAGLTSADFAKIAEDEVLSKNVLAIVRGRGVVTIITHVIDSDADPFVPEGWRVEYHHKAGVLEIDPKKIDLYLSEEQREGKTIEGGRLYERLAGQGALNASALDYFLANPESIPERWKESKEDSPRRIYFLATLYLAPLFHSRILDRCVRYLYWNGETWRWSCIWLGGQIGSQDPVTCFPCKSLATP